MRIYRSVTTIQTPQLFHSGSTDAQVVKYYLSTNLNITIPVVLFLITFQHVKIFLLRLLKYLAQKSEWWVIFNLLSSIKSDCLNVRSSHVWYFVWVTTAPPNTILLMRSSRNLPFTLPKLFLPNPHPCPRPDGVLYLTFWIWRLVLVVVVYVCWNFLLTSVLNVRTAWLWIMVIGNYTKLTKIEALISSSHSHFNFYSRVCNLILFKWSTLTLCFTLVWNFQLSRHSNPTHHMCGLFSPE